MEKHINRKQKQKGKGKKKEERKQMTYYKDDFNFS